MPFEVIDREVRFPETSRETFGNRGADHQRACEAGSACGCARVHIFHFDLGLACGALEQTGRMDEMIARSNLGHNSPMFFMLGDLRGDFARQQFMSAQDRDGCLIARGFEREDCFHLNRETRAVASHFLGRREGRPPNHFFTASPLGAFCCA